MGDTAANRDVVERLINEFVNDGDESVADELLAPDYVRYDPGAPGGTQDADEFKSMIRTYQTAFPDAEVSIEVMVAEDDLVVFRGREAGTHDGEFVGHEPTGQAFEITGLAMHRVEDGVVTETWANWDVLGLLQQLDIVPDDLTAMSD